MINYEKNPFYNIKSKKKLYDLLYISSKDLSFINSYSPYVKDGKRIIEKCNPDLRVVHDRIFSLLNRISLPDYLISSKKGKAYYDNYKIHVNNNYFWMLDIEKFYPKCDSYYVYKFFLDKLHMSEDVAYIMTQICTVDIDSLNLSVDVAEWFQKTEQSINYRIPKKHIPTGSPLSQLLAFLAYEDMFNEIEKYCIGLNLSYTVFVDDITLSSSYRISKKHIYNIKKILNKYGHNNNMSKNKYKKKHQHKRITGVVLDKNNNPLAQMKVHKGFKDSLDLFEMNKTNQMKSKLISYINCINLIEDNKYGGLKNKIKKEKSTNK